MDSKINDAYEGPYSTSKDAFEAGWKAALSAKAGICPHYYEATDGVHVVVMGQCKCKGRLLVPPAAPGKEQECFTH